MTAVATPPSVLRAGWPNASQSTLNQMSPDEVARLFMPRKGSQRGVPQGSEGGGVWGNGQIRGGTTSHDAGPAGGVGSLKNKKTTRGAPWPPKGDILRGPGVGSHSTSSSISSPTMNGIHQQAPILPSQHRGGQPTPLPGADNSGTSFLMLQPLNHSFETKLIPLPYYPDTLRIGRQTNTKTLPNSTNGYFDSKVLSRQHAEVWAEPKTGKVWIRDVKSSNGTFVNGTRLSQENKDSDPHELRAEDILELGIDIFSEDNKSIIHHKVAARVEHAGFQNGQMNLELNSLGDIDPIMGGGLMSPQFKQVNNFARGRSASQNSRAGSSAGGAGMMQRGAPMFIQSVSVEQIVKKLNSELHAAKQQAQELQRTQEFFDHLLNLEVIRKEPEIKKAEVESPGQSPMIDSGVALEAGQFQNISHHPLPPPAKHITVIPGAEKSEEGKKPPVHDISPPSPVSPPFKRSPKNTLAEPPQHLFSLVAQLRDARLELEAKSLRVKDLEDLLRREREAREMAEAQLQVAAHMPTDELPTDNIEKLNDDNILDDVSVAGSDITVTDSNDHEQSQEADKQSTAAAAAAAANAATEAAAMWQKKLEEMMAKLKAAQAEIETYKKRVKAAEEEGQQSKRTLVEMVAKIRADEEKRQKEVKETSVQTERKNADGSLRGKPVMVSCGVQAELAQDEDNEGEVFPGAIANATVKAVNGPLVIGGGKHMQNRHRDPNQQQQLQNLSTEIMKKTGEKRSMVKESVPYVTIVGVVVIGVSIMAILNNWQKGER